MKAFYFIAGILSIIVGILCLVNPFESFMMIGVIVAVLLLLVGIFFIAMFIMGRKNQTLTMDKPAIGIASLLLGIAMIVIAILSLAVPSIENALDMMIMIFVAVWMIFSGIVSAFTGISYRRQSQAGCALMIIFGIVIVAAGIYGLIHMVVFSETLGLVLGILLLLDGVDMICSAFISPGPGAEN